MKKIDALVKRVEFFERLAVFGNRSSFLKSLAQVTPFTQAYGPEVRQQVESALADLEARRIADSATVGAVMKGLNDISSFDKAPMISALEGALAKYPSDPNFAPQKEHLQNVISKLKGPAPQASNEQGGATTMYMPEGDPKDVVKALRPIDKGQQEALSRFVTITGLGLPLKADGKLGPETRKALDAMKKYVTEKNPAKPHMSDDDTLQMAKMIVDGNPDKYGKA